MARGALTMRLSDLVLVTWAVPESLLAPHLPPGCDLDLHNGHAFVSLVCFDLSEPRVVGIPVLAVEHYPGVNLRFYVRRGARPGVTFLVQLGSSRLVTVGARLLDQPYHCAVVTKSLLEHATLAVEYRATKQGRSHVVRVAGGPGLSYVPEPQSLEHFLTQRPYGYGRARGGGVRAFELEHPTWPIVPTPTVALDWEPARLFGPEWAFLGGAAPASVILALGSVASLRPVTH